jgi:GR25 family glycosyltransferase involved in LPS biosynthesis
VRKIAWYVINLDKETARYASVLSEADAFGVEIERLSAVNAENIEDIDEHYVSLGVRAAWLSHMNAMKRFLDSNLEFAIITEDDFHIDKPNRLKTILAKDSTYNYDFIQFGFLLPGVDTHIKFRVTNLQQKGFGLLSHLAKLPLFKNLKMGNRLRVREALLAPEGIIESDSLPGAHFYMVSRKFAKEVTSLNNPQYLSIDDFFSALSKMRAFKMGRTRKSFVSQLPFQSWTGSRFKAF